MEVCCINPSTPFEAAFDFLFVRGNFEKYFPSCWDFVKAMETPDNHRWVQAICTCRLMQLLPHPMFGVLLLEYELPSLEESKDTWRLARECCVAVVDVEVLVRVMRIFCPKDQDEHVLFDGAWRTSQLHQTRSRQQWIEFGKRATSDISFTRMWWNQDEAPYLESQDMRDAIFVLAHDERKRLRGRLFSIGRKVLLDEKKRNKFVQDMIDEADGVAKKKVTKAVKLDKKDIETAKTKADAIWKINLDVVKKVKNAISGSKVVVFDDRLAEVIVNITVAYPCLTWQLKAIVHTHFTADSTWAIERRLHGYKWFVIVRDPMYLLSKWVAATK